MKVDIVPLRELTASEAFAGSLVEQTRPAPRSHDNMTEARKVPKAGGQSVARQAQVFRERAYPRCPGQAEYSPVPPT